MKHYETEQEVKNAAISLLARRDYSRKELLDKLLPRCENLDVDAVLDQLEESGYQSDSRFTESFIRMRIGQGHGEIRIRYDLRQKGISSELTNAVLEESEVDWYEQAAELYRRKYSQPLDSSDYKERSKRMRYLCQRGFTPDQAGYAMESPQT